MGRMHKVGLTREHFERVFGPWAGVQRGLYVVHPRTGESVRWQDMAAEDQALYRARKRTPPTRRYYIADITPFRTGVMDSAETITTRREKADYMRRHDLYEWDDFAPPAPAEPDEAEIVGAIKKAIELDPAEREPLSDNPAERVDPNEAVVEVIE